MTPRIAQLIDCPDCGRQVAYQGYCPKCGGYSWLPAGWVNRRERKKPTEGASTWK